jgi:AmmeMemoRadiSam system protein A
LKKSGELRGCIGSIEAHRPLVLDVAHNAYAAAFLDHRFAPLDTRELAEISLDISILTPTEEIQFDNEADLIEKIRPGIDGLILEDGLHRGTFLPSVWESLPDVESFWRHLKLKAGLPIDHWSASLKVSRYTSESF